MAIDEKKLIDEVSQWYWDKGLQKVDEEWADLWIDMFIRTIKKQPKISLENKTSDNMNSSCSGQVWIPVEKALPRDSESVLICSKEGGVAEGCYSSQTKEWLQFRWSTKCIKVIAWQPLPKPYEVEK